MATDKTQGEVESADGNRDPVCWLGGTKGFRFHQRPCCVDVLFEEGTSWRNEAAGMCRGMKDVHGDVAQRTLLLDIKGSGPLLVAYVYETPGYGRCEVISNWWR